VSLLEWAFGAALATVGLAVLGVTAVARLGTVALPAADGTLLSRAATPGFALAGGVFALLGVVIVVTSRPEGPGRR
jgi:hypothetical protein